MKGYRMEFVADTTHELRNYVECFVELIENNEGAVVGSVSTFLFMGSYYECVVYVYGLEPEMCEYTQDYAYEIIFG